MNNTTEITVITPTFNSEKFILKNLESVRSQNFHGYEQIIIDNCSTDDTLNIIKNFNSKKLKIYSELDNGIYDAINKGIKLANGNLVIILNSDDQFYDNNVFNIILDNFKKNNVDILYGNIVYCSKKNENKIVRVWKSNHFKKDAFLKGWSPPHPSFVVKKEIYEKFGLYYNELGNPADIELMHRFLEKYKLKNLYINNFLVKMRLGGRSNASILNIIKQNFTIIKILKIKNLNLVKFIILKLINRIFQYTKHDL